MSIYSHTFTKKNLGNLRILKKHPDKKEALHRRSRCKSFKHSHGPAKKRQEGHRQARNTQGKLQYKEEESGKKKQMVANGILARGLGGNLRLFLPLSLR